MFTEIIKRGSYGEVHSAGRASFIANPVPLMAPEGGSFTHGKMVSCALLL